MSSIEPVKVWWRAQPWRRGHASLLLAGSFDRTRIARKRLTDREHMIAAVHWLGRAQDVTGDGGICGRYRLDRGWTSSYPETTGYLVPTLLRLAREWKNDDLRARARQAVEFLLPLQLGSGAFPGLEVKENRTEPSPFNTAQIVNGLIAWHEENGDIRALDAARRAGDWLLSIQEPDGSWKKHVYMGVSAAYHAHASCWLAQLGVHTGDEKYLRAAERHMDWVLSLRDAKTGFIDRAGFSAADHEARRAVTHTLAYTLWGVLYTGLAAKRDDAVAAVRFAAERVMRRMHLDGKLPGVLDAGFRRVANYQCLTGNAQFALIWMKLFELDGDARFLNAACFALDLVKAAQPIDNPNPGIRGGIPGSDPVTGGYLHLALPNWAAKFFLDAMLEKERHLAALATRPLSPPSRPRFEAPTSLPPISSRAATPPRIVLLATPRSRKCVRIVEALAARGLTPDAIVVESPPAQPLAARMRASLREEGLGAIARKAAGNPGASTPAPATPSSSSDVLALARTKSIPIVVVDSLASPGGVEAVRGARPDVLVCAGAGILKKPLLDLARLGTINAHMGLLPFYRGMNVAEWATLHHDELGVTVHLVDPGIDTGDILLTAPVDIAGATSITKLRELIDAEQIERLADVLRYVRDSGSLPPRVPQRKEDGRQFFTMHPELRRVTDAVL